MKTQPVSSLVSATASSVVYVATSHGASDSDKRIESSFKSSYVYETYLSDDRVKIEAKDGVVKLTGKVAENLHRILAREAASCLAGVSKVETELVTDEETAAESADIWISRKVKLALLFHRHVNASQTTVEVKDGQVTLRGDTPSEAQKELTGEYASDVTDVVGVTNELVVVIPSKTDERTPSEKVDDASVTAQVKAALLTHQSTHALSTKVVTRQGSVTLTGIARNEAEKSLVTKLVADIHGVAHLRNDMTIKIT